MTRLVPGSVCLACRTLVERACCPPHQVVALDEAGLAALAHAVWGPAGAPLVVPAPPVPRWRRVLARLSLPALIVFVVLATMFSSCTACFTRHRDFVPPAEYLARGSFWLILIGCWLFIMAALAWEAAADEPAEAPPNVRPPAPTAEPIGATATPWHDALISARAAADALVAPLSGDACVGWAIRRDSPRGVFLRAVELRRVERPRLAGSASSDEESSGWQRIDDRGAVESWLDRIVPGRRAGEARDPFPWQAAWELRLAPGDEVELIADADLEPGTGYRDRPEAVVTIHRARALRLRARPS